MLSIRWISATGTHFRYGTLWWEVDFTRTGLLAPVQLNPTISHNVVVVFHMQLAFQRDFKWGAFFGQQWRDASSRNSSWQNRNSTLSDWENQVVECNEAGVTCFPQDGSPTTDYISKYQIKFPNRQGTSPGVGMVPAGDPVMCRSPLHKVSPHQRSFFPSRLFLTSYQMLIAPRIRKFAMPDISVLAEV